MWSEACAFELNAYASPLNCGSEQNVLVTSFEVTATITHKLNIQYVLLTASGPPEVESKIVYRLVGIQPEYILCDIFLFVCFKANDCTELCRAF